jgi:hypothetical protein
MYRLPIFLLLSSTCFGQELWNGSRYGMKKAELEKLFGSRLKPDRRSGQATPRDYTLVVPEHFCGGDFEVDFTFLDEPAKGLIGVTFVGLSGNPDGVVGKCALEKLTSNFGQPKVRGTPESGQYEFQGWFSRRFTVLYIDAKKVVIDYLRR